MLKTVITEKIMSNEQDKGNNTYTDYSFQGQSPFAENAVSLLLADKSSVKYKGEEFEAIQFHYECQETEKCFTTDEIDEINIRIVFASYRNRMLLKQ